MMNPSKIRSAALAAVCLVAWHSAMLTSAFAAPAPVRLHWLDQPVAGAAQGVSWGVPWPQGAVPRGSAFRLTDAAGKNLPVQTWPLAYWPDGSLKWSGLATVVPAGQTGELTLAADSSAAPAGALRVTDDGKTVVIDTGALGCVIAHSGRNLIES